MEIANDVVNKIKKENIKPIPKWGFLLKNYTLIFLSLLNLLLGSVASALTIYLIVDNDVTGEPALIKNIWERLVLAVPLAWILLTAVFGAVAFYNFRKSEGGYRYNGVKLLVTTFLASVIVGAGLYYSGVAEKINDGLGSMPIYHQIFDLRSMVWSRPEDGYLAGVIEFINLDERIITIIDADDNLWYVEFSSALIRPSVEISDGNRIKIIGTKSGENSFIASEIRPWSGPGRNIHKN